jgi:acetyl esterase/lipase
MNLATAFFILSTFGLSLSGLVYFRARIAGALLVPTFLIGWARGELAIWTILLEGLVTFGFVAAGILDETLGLFGLGLSLASWSLLVASHRRSLATGVELSEALAPLGITFDREVSPFHGFPNPFNYNHPDVHRIQDLEYGESLPGDKGGRNLLDLVLPKSSQQGDLRPVILQVHGGAWVMGDKREQGRPLMTKLASEGWVCVAINYRLSPKGTMPDHIVDVKRSIAWIREHVGEYGGDPNFLCITGGSAGGHLSSLAALTANDPSFQPGFESVDTRVDACVPFYGVFDFLDRAGDRPLGNMSDQLGPIVFKSTPEEDPELWDSVCPVARVHAEAPPFFVIQGSHDSLVMAEEADTFVSVLRERSNQPVLHAELKGGQHAFEVFHSPRTEYAIRGAASFLQGVHQAYESGDTRV